MFKITTLSDKKVVANKAGVPSVNFLTVKPLKDSPQLKHFSANAL